MLVNKQVVITSIVENPDLYRQHFPKLIVEIDKVVQKPKCGLCINAFLKSMLGDLGFQKKMAIIFDDPDIAFAQDIQDCTVSVEDKTPYKSKTKVEVFFLYVNDCKDFIEKFTEDKLVRSINTTYIPGEKEGIPGKVMVTIHWSTLS
jgi:hypothetical protein